MILSQSGLLQLTISHLSLSEWVYSLHSIITIEIETVNQKTRCNTIPYLYSIRSVIYARTAAPIYKAFD